MHEEDTLKPVKALVVSRVTYSLPYHCLSRSETDEIEAILTKAYKTALGLPQRRATEKLLQLGISNTYEDFKKAHRLTQLRRLQKMYTGRWILYRLHFTNLAKATRRNLDLAPIPRNLHPEKDREEGGKGRCSGEGTQIGRTSSCRHCIIQRNKPLCSHSGG